MSTETYTGIFTDSLFIIAQTWKQQMSFSRQMDGLHRCIQTVEYCLVQNNKSTAKTYGLFREEA